MTRKEKKIADQMKNNIEVQKISMASALLIVLCHTIKYG